MSNLDYDRIAELCKIVTEMDKHGTKFKAIRDEAYNELMAINDEFVEAKSEKAPAPKGRVPLTSAKAPKPVAEDETRRV